MNPIFKNLKYLHIVRGLAAFIVVVFHAKYALWVGGTVFKRDHGLNNIQDYFLFSIDMLSSCGEQCVIIFFILSAFVIYHSFEKYKNDLTAFYKLRLFRIYIPFLFSIVFSIAILILCVVYLNPLIDDPGFREYNKRLHTAYADLSLPQILNTVFLTGRQDYSGANYAYWSLGHELIFYILFPVYFFLRTNIRVILILVFLICYLSTGWTIFYFQMFFIGGLLLYDFFSKRVKPVFKNQVLYFILLIPLYIFINISIKVISKEFADAITFIFCFFLFDYILHYVHKIPRLINGLGNISYTLYLNHLPLLLLFYTFLTLWTGKLVFYSRLPYYTGVIFALLGSIPLYFLIEKPSIAFLRKLRSV